MKIATFNVNSIRSRLHIVIPWLEKKSPEFLCMQETRVGDDKFPEDKFQEIGYNVVYSGNQKGRNGVAIATKEKPEKITKGFNTKPYEKDRILTAKFEHITVINTYIPQGYKINSNKYRYKLDWFDRFKNYLEENYLMNDFLVWGGDMNVAPLDIDVHSPKRLKNHVCFHQDVKEKFEDVKKLGFIDLFREYHHGEKNQYTFYDYRTKEPMERNIGWRVDHILGTEKVKSKSINSYIDIEPRRKEKPSDHTPLIFEMQKL
ncbi:MAG: exodeoxyribonuclease III [Candidatus Thermoplasmatota archaeon]